MDLNKSIWKQLTRQFYGIYYKIYGKCIETTVTLEFKMASEVFISKIKSGSPLFVRNAVVCVQSGIGDWSAIRLYVCSPWRLVGNVFHKLIGRS